MQEVLHIEVQQKTDRHELLLEGRLDAFGSRTLEQELGEQLKQGHYKLTLNLREVQFLSSAGIRVLIKYFKELKSIGGQLQFTELPETIAHVIELAGLTALFEEKEAPTSEKETTKQSYQTTESGVFQILKEQKKSLTAKLSGDPGLLETKAYGPEDATIESFGGNRFALGLGALGSSFEESQSRFGEYMAVGDVAIHLPTDGTNSADYIQKTNQLIPEVVSLYSMVLEGEFGTFMNFECKEGAASVPLSEIAQALFDSQNAKAIGMVMLAETTGLCGCSLNVSPLKGGDTNPFGFPGIKERMSITTEPEYDGCLTLTFGVIQKGEKEMESFTRPFGKGDLWGHFHSSVFGFRPVQKDDPDLMKAVNGLLEGSSLMGLLHLIDDHRPHNGIGESGFVRGACWVGPIDELKKEES